MGCQGRTQRIKKAERTQRAGGRTTLIQVGTDRSLPFGREPGAAASNGLRNTNRRGIASCRFISAVSACYPVTGKTAERSRRSASVVEGGPALWYRGIPISNHSPIFANLSPIQV